MKKIFLSILLFLLCLCPVSAKTETELKSVLDNVIYDTGNYIYEQTKNNTVMGSEANEWAVIGLARSGIEIPSEYYQNYFESMKNYISESKGVLHRQKYTEYSRVILALTAIGTDPQNINGYNLISPLGDYNKTIRQGINGPVWALIALNSNDYNIPKSSDNEAVETKEAYLNLILKNQLPSGGWNLAGASVSTVADPDVTGMVLCALAEYSDRDNIKSAIDKGLLYLSNIQNEDGGYSGWDIANSESSAQILTALSTLGISINDPRFIKNGNTVLDNLLSFYKKGQGFYHTLNDKSTSLMATEQCFYALVAAQRAINKKQSLYKMTKKDFTINVPPIQISEITFNDISNHENKKEIEILAKRKIIYGKSDKLFDPDGKITRAEFAAIITRALGLKLISVNPFEDVSKNAWYYDYVKTAYSCGIIKGISISSFAPDKNISFDDALTMIKRASFILGYSNQNTYESESSDAETVSRAQVCAMLCDLMRKAGLI